MPYRRSYGHRDPLTGGTGDTNPQVYGITASQPGIDLGLEIEMPVPVLRMGMSMSRAQVIEVTKVEFEIPYSIASETDDDQQFNCSLTSRSVGATVATLAEPHLLAKYARRVLSQAAGAVANLEVVQTEKIVTFDTTDGAGHGLLVTSSNLYFQINTANTGVANAWGVRVFYRFKQIGARAFAAAAVN